MQKPQHLLFPIRYVLYAIRYVLALSVLVLPALSEIEGSEVEGLFASPAQAIDIGAEYPLASDRSLGDYITPLVTFAVVGAGVIAFLLFLGGGIMMISSAGNPEKQGQGRSAITAGVIGLVLVAAAYWIVQIVEVLTGLNLLNPGL